MHLRIPSFSAGYRIWLLSKEPRTRHRPTADAVYYGAIVAIPTTLGATSIVEVIFDARRVEAGPLERLESPERIVLDLTEFGVGFATEQMPGAEDHLLDGKPLCCGCFCPTCAQVGVQQSIGYGRAALGCPRCGTSFPVEDEGTRAYQPGAGLPRLRARPVEGIYDEDAHNRAMRKATVYEDEAETLTETESESSDGAESVYEYETPPVYSSDSEFEFEQSTDTGAGESKGEGKDLLLSEIRKFLRECGEVAPYWPQADVDRWLAVLRDVAKLVGADSPLEAEDVVFSLSLSQVGGDFKLDHGWDAPTSTVLT